MFKSLVFCVLFSVIEAGYADSISLKCESAIEEQLDAYMVVIDAFRDECEAINNDLEVQGLPHCGALCTKDMVRTFRAPVGSVQINVGNSSGIGGYSMGGYSMQTSSTGAVSKSFGSSEPTFSVNISLSFEIGPTTQLQCVNPMFAPEVTEFANTVLTSEWVLEKFENACSSVW